MRWISSLLAVVPVFLAVTLTPAAASAAACPANRVCFYSGQFGGDSSIVGAFATDSDLSNNGYDTNRARSMNNTISAVTNNTGRWVRLFDGKNHTNAMVCIGPGVAHPLWKPLNGQIHGDRTTSFKVVANCGA